MYKSQKSQGNIINVACTIDNNYVQHCAVMLASLLDSNKSEFFEIYIIHNGIENNNKRKIEKFLSKQSNCKYKLILLDEKYLLELPVNLPLFGHISIATYFRIFLAEVLPKTLDKVLFLDSDMIIRKGIRWLWETNLEGYSHAAAINPGLKDHFSNLYQQAVNPTYFNAGVLLINLQFWRENAVLSKACNLIRNYGEKLKCWDQDVLNILLNSDWLRVGLTWNATPRVFRGEIKPEELMTDENTDAVAQDPAIVHFAGGGFHKPWYFQCEHPFKDLYKKYLKKTPWSNHRLIGEPSLILKLRMQLKLGTRLKKILSFRI
jgi:lipopolysaccharide biosynthesis glycosyltransferase